MTMPAVEERVDHLQEAIDRFIASVGVEFNKLYNSQMRTEAELREFKDEMRAFKDEMRAENREMNRRWGELANRLGTLVEDLVAPSFPRIVKEVLGIEVDDLFVRYRGRRQGQTYEYAITTPLRARGIWRC
jgi:phage-related minor tail protein